MGYLNRDNGYEPTGEVNSVAPLNSTGFKRSPNGAAHVELHQVTLDIKAEFKRAIDKHGFARTPANPHMSDGEILKILVEEVGEVARAMTYDEGDVHKLTEELVQVATMAAAAVVGIRSRFVTQTPKV